MTGESWALGCIGAQAGRVPNISLRNPQGWCFPCSGLSTTEGGCGVRPRLCCQSRVLVTGKERVMTNTVMSLQKIDSRAQPISRRRPAGSVGRIREISRAGWGAICDWLECGPGLVLAVCCLATVPSRVDACRASVVNACIANMKALEGAKVTWALEHRMGTNAVPQAGDLFGPSRYHPGLSPMSPWRGIQNQRR